MTGRAKPGRIRVVWWQTIVCGLAAAVVAGMAVLATGARLAMRIVAIQDPLRATEFSFGGTIVIFIIFGLIVAAPLGIVAAILARYLPRWSIAVVVTLLGMSQIAADSAITEEFFELGAGPWVNFPLFAAVFVLFVLADLAVYAFFCRKLGSGDKVAVEEVLV